MKKKQIAIIFLLFTSLIGCDEKINQKTSVNFLKEYKTPNHLYTEIIGIPSIKLYVYKNVLDMPDISSICVVFSTKDIYGAISTMSCKTYDEILESQKNNQRNEVLKLILKDEQNLL